jgi:hypothetical protein
MKNLSKKQTVASHVDVLDYEDDDVNEIVFAKWLVARAKKEEEDVIARQKRWAQYFGSEGCYEHDRYGCRQCSNHARGICPSAKEESY